MSGGIPNSKRGLRDCAHPRFLCAVQLLFAPFPCQPRRKNLLRRFWVLPGTESSDSSGRFAQGFNASYLFLFPRVRLPRLIPTQSALEPPAHRPVADFFKKGFLLSRPLKKSPAGKGCPTFLFLILSNIQICKKRQTPELQSLPLFDAFLEIFRTSPFSRPRRP